MKLVKSDKQIASEELREMLKNKQDIVKYLNNNFTGWIRLRLVDDIDNSVNIKYFHVMYWEIKTYDNLSRNPWIPPMTYHLYMRIDGDYHEYQLRGLRIPMNAAFDLISNFTLTKYEEKETPRIYKKDDPYGEENWDDIDEINELRKLRLKTEIDDDFENGKFHIGQKVNALNNKGVYASGTIVDIKYIRGDIWYGIEFDEYCSAYSCNGKAKAGHGFWTCDVKEIEKEKPISIKWYKKGKLIKEDIDNSLLHVGQRVLAVDKNGGQSKGKIVKIGNYYSIEFDNWINGHSCGGIAKHGHGWNVHIDNIIEILDDNEIKKIKWYNKGKLIEESMITSFHGFCNL